MHYESYDHEKAAKYEIFKREQAAGMHRNIVTKAATKKSPAEVDAMAARLLREAQARAAQPTAPTTAQAPVTETRRAPPVKGPSKLVAAADAAAKSATGSPSSGTLTQRADAAARKAGGR